MFISCNESVSLQLYLFQERSVDYDYVYAIWKELEHLELPVTGSNSELMLIVAGILLTGTGVILLIRKRKSRKL